MYHYFLENYENLQFRKAKDNYKGLRKAQLGAVHAIASYFTKENSNQALVVLPTGERVIIVMGAINVLVSRFSGTFIKYNSCIA